MLPLYHFSDRLSTSDLAPQLAGVLDDLANVDADAFEAGAFGGDEAGIGGDRVADAADRAGQLGLEAVAQDIGQLPLQFGRAATQLRTRLALAGRQDEEAESGD